MLAAPLLYNAILLAVDLAVWRRLRQKATPARWVGLLAAAGLAAIVLVALGGPDL